VGKVAKLHQQIARQRQQFHFETAQKVNSLISSLSKLKKRVRELSRLTPKELCSIAQPA
jgi:excinuclease UvrABC nuclease subunit